MATSTDASCLYNTAADTCAASGTHLYKRTHTLSNGEEIWDFSGNVWEWNDWNVLTDRANSGTAAFIEINTSSTPTVTMTAETFQSTNNTLTATTNAIGRYFPNTDGAGGAAIRGSSWDGGVNAGVFTLVLLFPPLTSNASVGFRCARSL